MRMGGGRISLAEERYSETPLGIYTPEVLQEILAPVQATRHLSGQIVPVICDPFCKNFGKDTCPHRADGAPKDKGFCDCFVHAADSAHQVDAWIQQQFAELLVDTSH